MTDNMRAAWEREAARRRAQRHEHRARAAALLTERCRAASDLADWLAPAQVRDSVTHYNVSNDWGAAISACGRMSSGWPNVTDRANAVTCRKCREMMRASATERAHPNE